MRRLAAGFVPCALFVTCLLVLIRADSFSGRSRWHDAFPRTVGGGMGAVLGIAACASVLALLLSPFQIGAVRILEGYWGQWRPAARMASVLVEYQRRRLQQLHEANALAGDSQEGEDPEVAVAKPLSEQIHDLRLRAEVQRSRIAAQRRLAALPSGEVLLPTALGNALRAGELGAGERYGLATLASWPRIYPQVSGRLAAALDSARDQLDTAANLCHSFAACAVVMAIALYDQPRVWWLPALALALAALAYKAAVAAGRSYTALMHVVYDLHRFDLVRALHYQLPGRDDEWGLFRRISDALEGGAVNLPYHHGGSGPDEAHGTGQSEEV